MSSSAAPQPGGVPAGPLADLARSGPLEPAVAIGMLQRAQALADQGDWGLGAATFARVVGNSDPNLHVAALLGLAECRYRLDDEAAAIQCWITATQAPETPLAWRAWKALAAARVRGGDVPGAARAYREADRRAPDSERAEIASRLGWLSKEMGDHGAAQRHFRRSRSDLAGGTIVTLVILAVTIGIGISSLLLDQGNLWFDLFAFKRNAVVHGEYWRLLTVVLVHDGPVHLAFNMYALYIIGPIVERLYGPVRFLFLYLVCGLAGSAASFAFSHAPASVGASGAIFGLFGVLLIADRVHKPALTRGARQIQRQIGMLIVLNLVIGVTIPRIDNAAHIGGLIAGCWLGYVLVPRGATTLRSMWNTAAATARNSAGGMMAPRGDAFDPTRLLRLLGVAALFAVIAVGVIIGQGGGVRLS